MTRCGNCAYESEDKFCSKCGQQMKLERIDRYYFSTQLQHVLNFDRGIIYTIKELIVRPGKALNEYVFENRNKYIRPITFLVFTSIVFTLTTYFLDIQYSYFNINNITVLQDKVSLGALGEWLNNNVAYTNLILGFFFAFWIKIFFKKSNNNIYEITVVLCFVLGITTLIQSFSFMLWQLTNNGIMSLIGFLFFIIYPIWAIGQFFGKKKIMNYVKSMMILILGSLSYFVVFILIGYIFKLLQS